MENKIIALEAQLEMNNELINSEYHSLITKVEDIIKKFITEPHGAIISRRLLRIGFRDTIEIVFEVGFHNEAENGLDFGSDVFFEYNTEKNELAVQCGTIGNYTKSNIYQIKRVNLIAGVFAHINEIEAAFAEVAEIADSGNYRTYIEEEYKIESEIRQIKKAIKDQQLKEIAYSLKEGDTLKHIDTIRRKQQIFDTTNGAWTIYRICEKTIKIKSPISGEVRQFPKERIVALINQGYLMVNAEENVNE